MERAGKSKWSTGWSIVKQTFSEESVPVPPKVKPR